MSSADSYNSSIPECAREQVTETRGDGSKARADYFVGAELVGSRIFDHNGSVEHEYAYRDGDKHGWEYRWDAPGVLLSVTFYENGMEHGTASQWGRDGRLVGTYTMVHGTGIDLWWKEFDGQQAELAEAREYVDGRFHGYEWTFSEQLLSSETHFVRGMKHGIARRWTFRGDLERGAPAYWIWDKQVTKREYVRAARLHADLPPFRQEENTRRRVFPKCVARLLA